jgi:hypothetical protein
MCSKVAGKLCNGMFGVGYKQALVFHSSSPAEEAGVFSV